MLCRNLYLLPVIIPIWFCVTFVITYIISVSRKDTIALFPYISDTGTWSPASCIFGQMLNLGALMLLLFFYTLHEQIKELVKLSLATTRIFTFSKTAYILGIISALGISIVGNFQETNVFFVHMLGAFFGFGLGTVYQIMQTYISCQTFPRIGCLALNRLRIVCCIVSVLNINITFITAIISLHYFKGNDISKWTVEDGGFKYHIASTITEWILAINTMLFIGTYTYELKAISITPPSVSLKQNA